MKIALCGLGKAGIEFVKQTALSKTFDLSLVVARKESATIGCCVSEIANTIMKKELYVKCLEDVSETDEFDVLVDFSGGDTTIKLAELCAKLKRNLIICPTNFSEEQVDYFKNIANKNNIGIVFAQTLTIGINMLIDFVKKLDTIFSDFDFEIIERHPKNKSKPTTTSKIIASNIQNTDAEIVSIRLDGYVGVHEVIATNGSERITISHESLSRKAFADGAILAAHFIENRHGFYEMKDIFYELITEYHKNNK